jgi:hypothetical protein
MVANIQDKVFVALIEEDCGFVKRIQEMKKLDPVDKVVAVFGIEIWESGTAGPGQIA